MSKQLQFYIYKLTTSRLLDSDYNIKDLSTSVAREQGELIALGDNQIVHFINKIKGINIDKDHLKMLYRDRDFLKSQPTNDINKKNIKKRQEEIDGILFLPDLINIKVDNTKIYRHICKHGFVVDGRTFVRLACGAGQARRATVTFVNKDLYNELNEILMNGLDIDEINLSKFSAYYGLYLSAVSKVTTPRVCVVDDCELKIINKRVDYVVDKQRVLFDGEVEEYRDIESRTIDPVMNVFDGQGLISPEMAQKWTEDMDLDYTACQFIIRSSFIKGMLTTFDFKAFAKEVANKTTIKDLYGKEWLVDEIDVILSASQFKMCKLYKSWDEYMQFSEKYGHIWGVAKVNKEYDDECSLLNYQYLQTLNLNDEDIKNIASPTIEWIERICEGDKLYTLLFLLGAVKEGDDLEAIMAKVGSDFVKAILYNDILLNDDYIKKKIYKYIEKRIKDAKIGRLWARGNYQVMIADPYAQCEFIFGLEVKGLLNEFEYYSDFWNKRAVNKAVACRSPLVDFSEVNILNLKNNEELEKWYGYNYSGIIYNIWGLDTILHSDSDFDGDIVATYDNDILMNNKLVGREPITYDKAVAPKQKFNLNNLVSSDIKGFNSKIGQTTNYSTCFIAMLPKFKEDSSEYNELMNRIKTLRRYIGDAIDSAKGIKTKAFPTSWKRRVKVNEDDSLEVKTDKYYLNSLVCNKKPYFMIYIYDVLMKEYKQYKKNQDRYCREHFGCKINDLMSKEEKSKEEKFFISSYYNQMPVLRTNCVTNKLCWLIESIDFKFKFKNKSSDNSGIIQVLSDKTILKNDKTFKQVEELFLKFEKLKKRVANIKVDTGETNDDIDVVDEFYKEMRLQAETICSNKCELANYAVELVYLKYPKKNKDFAWSVCKDGLLENVKNNRQETITIPALSDEGVEYLGKRYVLKEI